MDNNRIKKLSPHEYKKQWLTSDKTTYRFLPKDMKGELDQLTPGVVFETFDSYGEHADALISFYIGCIGEKAIKGMPLSANEKQLIGLLRKMYLTATGG